MLHKVSDLEGPLLDAAVAKAEGVDKEPGYAMTADGPEQSYTHPHGDYAAVRQFRYSRMWLWGGPLIERERISVGPGLACWYANIGGRGDDYAGPAPLIAAMRAYVASKFGETVELP